MHYQGIFFDFDYTLGDSTIPILRGYQEGFRALGWDAPTLEQVRPTIGMTLMEGYRQLTGDQDSGRADEFYHQFQLSVGELAGPEGRRVMVEESCLLPGAVETLTALKLRGVNVAIVSTKLAVTIREIFQYNHADDLLDLIVGGRDVKRNKPDQAGAEAGAGVVLRGHGDRRPGGEECRGGLLRRPQRHHAGGGL